MFTNNKEYLSLSGMIFCAISGTYFYLSAKEVSLIFWLIIGGGFAFFLQELRFEILLKNLINEEVALSEPEDFEPVFAFYSVNRDAFYKGPALDHLNGTWTISEEEAMKFHYEEDARRILARDLVIIPPDVTFRRV